MRIIPVLDVQAGRVVRGIGGRREEYRPILSKLASSSDPVDVAVAFRSHLNVTQLYLADLDAIAGSPPALATYAVLQSNGFRLWVDAGVHDAKSAAVIAAATVEGVVLGLETLSGPSALACACRQFGDRIVFSLDLKAGEPLGDRTAWGNADPWSIAERAVATGLSRMIVLDLAHVGTGVGVGTEELCAQLTRTYPQLEVIAGGGVRDISDLRRLRQCRVHGVLVASALHDGTLCPEHLAAL
jgi:phosphoribosylformimino-5-aminoimidazole carboxamide ribotide isomerase